MEVSPAMHPTITSHTGTEMNPTNPSSTPADVCFRDSLPGGFSFIVDDVDGDPEPEVDYVREDVTSRVTQELTREGSPDSKEQSDARIQQIKEDAESRKNEFARLLEEHAQVIQQLKKMEHEPGPGTAVAGPTEA